MAIQIYYDQFQSINMKYDVFGLGNALMDLLIEVSDVQLSEIINRFDLKKGEIRLFDENTIKGIVEEIKKFNVTISPGGSCANTMHGIEILGGKAAFCGKVGRDEYGDLYEKKMETVTALARSDKMTGLAITFISPDGERTFADHLGAAISLQEEDLDQDLLEKCEILHLTGYLLEEKNLRALATKAMNLAKESGKRVSIDLGDPGLVMRNKNVITGILEQYADIVFANEDEAKALTGLPEIEALSSFSEMADIAIVKLGENGSYIQHGKKVERISGYPVKAVDTTGAGDMFAAGVLYGISKNHSLRVSGHLGSYYAAKVVQQVTARLESIDKLEKDELIRRSA
ncbi:MAG: adenosine kinase [Candidatus Hodarchaeales archaeon]